VTGDDVNLLIKKTTCRRETTNMSENEKIRQMVLLKPLEDTPEMNHIWAMRELRGTSFSLDDIEGINAAWKTLILKTEPLTEKEMRELKTDDPQLKRRMLNKARKVYIKHMREEDCKKITQSNDRRGIKPATLKTVEETDAFTERLMRSQMEKEKRIEEDERKALILAGAEAVEKSMPGYCAAISEETRRNGLVGCSGHESMKPSSAKAILGLDQYPSDINTILRAWEREMDTTRYAPSKTDPRVDIKQLNKAREVMLAELPDLKPEVEQWLTKHRELIAKHQSELREHFQMGYDEGGEMTREDAMAHLKLSINDPNNKFRNVLHAWEAAVLPEKPGDPKHPTTTIRKMNQAVVFLFSDWVKFDPDGIKSWIKKMNKPLERKHEPINQQTAELVEHDDQPMAKQVEHVDQPMAEQQVEKIGEQYAEHIDEPTEEQAEHQGSDMQQGEQHKVQLADDQEMGDVIISDEMTNGEPDDKPEVRIHRKTKKNKKASELFEKMRHVFAERLERKEGTHILFNDVHRIFTAALGEEKMSKLDEGLFRKHCKDVLSEILGTVKASQIRAKRCYLNVAAKP
jgi:hypothetical protein